MEDSGRRSAGFAPTEAGTPGQTPPGGGPPPSGSGSGPRLIADDADLLAGMVLGKYQIVQRLGSGGMGSVYEAVHRDIAKPVALKTLAARLASEPAAQARFLREAASASRLTHPHVVDVTDFGSDGGITFLVMELLRGEDLAAALAREPGGLSIAHTADIMLAVCAGVFAAHEAGIIHRDLKPPNIFLARGGLDDVVPKVLDFGISKLLDEQMSQTLTGTGTVLGTTPYLSPEQVGGKAIDARSDQYTLGVILYECVTGRRPHEGETLFAIMRSIADARFRRPRELRPEIPPAFEALILRAMSQDPERRFETVHALGHALLPFASQRPRLLWSEYFGTERGVKSTSVLPRTEALPELPRAPRVAMEIEPLDSTSTRDRPRTTPRYRPTETGFSDSVLQLPPRSRAPWLVVGLLAAAGLAFGAYVYLQPPPGQPVPVEKLAPRPRSQPLEPERPMEPAPPPKAVAETPEPPPKVVETAPAKDEPVRPVRPGHKHPKFGTKPPKSEPTPAAQPETRSPILD
jgi:serine/threonine protein kinase